MDTNKGPGVSLKDRLRSIEHEVEGALLRTGRTAGLVQIVAVTKYLSAEDMAPLIDAGLRVFGENRWQVAKPKVEMTYPWPVEWHFIGRLQKNKVQPVVRNFAWIQSVDSVSLLSAISESAERQGVVSQCLLQVNVSGETSKQGLQPEAVLAAVRAGMTLQGVRLRGLMTMAPRAEEAEAARPVFKALRDLQQSIQRQVGVADFDQLSMGMSSDYVAAVEEGATLIRIGRKLVLGDDSLHVDGTLNRGKDDE